MLTRLILGLLLVAVPGVAFAQSLAVVPRRVVLDDSERASTITVVNNDSESVRVRFLLRRSRMTTEGDVQTATDQVEFGPDEVSIRFAPAAVTLPPNGRQTIRFIARRPVEMAVGEQRYHFVAFAEPDVPDLPDLVEGTDQLQMSAIITNSVAIPVITRKGSPTAKVTIESANLAIREPQPDDPQIEDPNRPFGNVRLEVTREGTHSAYGHIVIRDLLASADDDVLFYLGGIAIYHDLDRRFVNLTLNEEQFELVAGAGQPVIQYYAPLDGTGETYLRPLDDLGELLASRPILKIE